MANFQISLNSFNMEDTPEIQIICFWVIILIEENNPFNASHLCWHTKLNFHRTSFY
jgi:hypothetical protein